MKKYRIIERNHPYYELNEGDSKLKGTERVKVRIAFQKKYIAQKRFLGFLWWYNFNNIDGTVTGVYDTLEEAELAIKNDRLSCKYNDKIIQEYD